jgi:CheY-like chemotaxis protein
MSEMTVRRPLRVLIVGDSPDDAERMIHILRRAGFAPEWTRVTGAAALTDAAGAGDWDLITCDAVMSGFDGMEAVLIARSAAPHTPVIAVAADAREARSMLLLKLGAFACVDKRDLATLPDVVASALSAPRLVRSSSKRVAFLRRALDS